MKMILLCLICLVGASAAAEPTYYELDDFLKNASRNPNKCVSKGATFKCVGYEDISGIVFNNKTKHAYLYNQDGAFELFAEYQCDEFVVSVNFDRTETIKCDEMTLLYEARCNTTFDRVEVLEYDELGILVDKKQLYNGADLCRKKFHHQYGNDSGKPYESEAETRKQDSDSRGWIGGRRGKADGGFNEGYAEGGSGEIGYGLADMLGGGGGGIATKAKGSIKTPSERDIDVGSGGSRSAAEIMKVVRQRNSGLRHIYNKFLKKKPGFSGKVTLKFTIAPDGEVISISVASSNTGYAEFDGEIKTAVSRWKFNRVKSGNTTVKIPFTFSE